VAGRCASRAGCRQFRLFANRHTALLAAIYDSIARAARDWLVTWLGTRIPGSLGQPLSSLPRVQEKVGQIDGWLLVNRTCWKRPRSWAFPPLRRIWRKSRLPTTPFRR
jgi:alkylation response protein AidB-like acyl-CoA dehydrogenase